MTNGRVPERSRRNLSGSSHQSEKINTPVPIANQTPRRWPKTCETTRLLAKTSANESDTAPHNIWREASVLKRERSRRGRNIRCCTAGAANRTRLVSEQQNVARNIHFSDSTICENPLLNGSVMRNAVSNWAAGNRTRNSLRRSERSPSPSKSSRSSSVWDEVIFLFQSQVDYPWRWGIEIDLTEAISRKRLRSYYKFVIF
jgi:hypothetical protein